MPSRVSLPFVIIVSYVFMDDNKPLCNVCMCNRPVGCPLRLSGLGPWYTPKYDTG